MNNEIRNAIKLELVTQPIKTHETKRRALYT